MRMPGVWGSLLLVLGCGDGGKAKDGEPPDETTPTGTTPTPTGCDDPVLVHADVDEDGFGDPATATRTCEPPAGWISDGSDCDDGNDAVHPGAEERCNGVDDDCDLDVDVGAIDPSSWYADADGDGYGTGEPVLACDAPKGHAALDGDCDDGLAERNPGLSEVCNNHLDDDCSEDAPECLFEGVTDLSLADVTWTTDPSAMTGVLINGDDAVSVLGDVDGDGFADVLVGAAWTDTPATGAGAAILVYGSATVASGSIAAEASFTGDGANELVGWAVAPAGDVDADGFVDFVVGGPDDDALAGSAFLFYGGAQRYTGAELAGDAAAARVHGSGSQQVGRGLAAAGDLDGDGHDDVLVGSGTEEVRLVYGSAARYAGDLAFADLPGFAADAGTGVGELGTIGAGDLNGDGLDDLAFGAPLARSGGVDRAGRTFLAYGSASRLVGTTDLEQAHDVAFEGPSFDAGDTEFGESLDVVGDVNGDGYADLLVGGYDFDANGSTSGGAWLFLGGSALPARVFAGDAVAAFEGGSASDLLGETVAGVGDVDLDGFGDLAVASTGWEPTGAPNLGGVSVFQGGPALAGTLSMTDGDLQIHGIAGADWAGTAIDGGPDVNGDGYPDLIVTAGGEDAVYLFHATGL